MGNKNRKSNQRPDLTHLSAQELLDLLKNWIQEDPVNRKQAVMAMLPELSKYIM